MNLKTLFLFLGLVVIGITILKLRVKSKFSEPPSISQPAPPASTPPKTKSQSRQSKPPPPSPSTKPETAKRPTQTTPSNIGRWLEERANSMSTFSKSDQRELKEKVQKLTPEDLKSLSRISLSNTAPANARVLAVYMMGESDHGLAALTEFLSAKINLQENSPAHSVNEAANGREKALRIMAIEHIIENSPNASEAKKRLSDLIPKISDPWLRDFTERRLSETR